jgi:hypothetical protein
VAVTYDDALSTDRDKVRFYLHDTVEDSGPFFDGSNFSDDEITGLITVEGSWQRAVAGGLEILASAYAPLVDTSIGARRESLSQAAARYEAMAKKWRAQYGRTGGGAGVRHVTRIDGYSQDVSSDET